jgi:hypothetical protein
MSTPNDKLAEPNVVPAELPQRGAAQAADNVDTQTSALGDILGGMQKLRPVEPEESAAQRASEATQEPEKKEFPPVGTSDIKEQKQVESKMDEQAEPGSALEGFQSDLRKARRAKERAARKPADQQQEPQPEEQKPAEEGKAETPKVETPKVETPPADDAPVSEEEIQKTINDPAISKRHQKRMIYLANKAKELEKKLADAEAKKSSPENDEKVKELAAKVEANEKELIKYQRRYSLESDPELKKFDDIAKQADEAIYGRLSGLLSEKTVDLIKKMGGLEGFSRSNQVFTVDVAEDGETVQRQVTAADLTRQWLNTMNVADSEFIRAKLGERINAADAKQRKAQELVEDSEKWFAERQREAAKQQEAQQNAAKEYYGTYEKRTAEFIEKEALLKDRVVPPNATPEERKEIEDYNAHNAGVRALVKMAAAPKSVDDHVAVVQEAARSLVNAREVKRLSKEVERLTEELNKVRKGVSTTGKPGSASISRTPPKAPDTSAASQLKTPVADSLREAMENLRNRSE